MAEVFKRQDGAIVKEVAGSAGNPGDVKNFAAGMSGVRTGLNPHASGDTVGYDCGRKVYEMKAKSTFVGAVGDLCEWDNGNSEVVDDGDVDGDFDLGRLVKAKANGELTAWVCINFI